MVKINYVEVDRGKSWQEKNAGDLIENYMRWVDNGYKWWGYKRFSKMEVQE